MGLIELCALLTDPVLFERPGKRASLFGALVALVLATLAALNRDRFNVLVIT